MAEISIYVYCFSFIKYTKENQALHSSVLLHKNQYKILFSQVQDAFRCRLRNCQDPINADSSSSFPNGHAQIMVRLYFFLWFLIWCSYAREKNLHYCMWQVCAAEVLTPFLSTSLFRSLSACLYLLANLNYWCDHLVEQSELVSSSGVLYDKRFLHRKWESI